MERIFRKHFWAVHLTFLFLTMLLIARLVNQFVDAGLSKMVSAPVLTVAAPVVAEVSRPQLSLDRLAKLTGLAVPAPEPTVVEPSEPVIDLNAAPVHTSLRVKLLGTLVASSPEWSIASIQDVVTQKSSTFMVGDTIQTAQVLEIERDKVIILHNNRREFIDANPGDGSNVAMAPPPITAPSVAVASNQAPPGSNVLGNGIKSTGENEYEVPKGEIDKTLSNLNDVAMQARIVPAFKDGVSTGFKLFSIRPDSIYTKIGVQNGDVIRRINGYDLNSPEKALEVYSKLKEANRIDIELERNGSVVRKTYNIR